MKEISIQTSVMKGSLNFTYMYMCWEEHYMHMYMYVINILMGGL